MNASAYLLQLPHYVHVVHACAFSYAIVARA